MHVQYIQNFVPKYTPSGRTSIVFSFENALNSKMDYVKEGKGRHSLTCKRSDRSRIRLQPIPPLPNTACRAPKLLQQRRIPGMGGERRSDNGMSENDEFRSVATLARQVKPDVVPRYSSTFREYSFSQDSVSQLRFPSGQASNGPAVVSRCPLPCHPKA